MWELGQIAEFGLQSPVVVVLPPPRGRRKRPNMAAVAQARSIVATLSGATTVDYGLGEPISDAFRTTRSSSAPRFTHARRSGGSRSRRSACPASATRAAGTSAAEMSDWSFGARYSV
jgi:hypothetical protein